MLFIKLFIISLIGLSSFTFPQSSGQIDFVTQFYKKYLDATRGDSILSDRSVLSQSARNLLDSNRIICERKAGTDVCGFDADGDMFLNTQEIGSNLNFTTSSFTAKSVSSDCIEVSFTVWPGIRAYYDKKLRLTLLHERGQWRIDDIAWPDDKGIFKPENTMRFAIKKEIEFYSMEENVK